VTRPTPVFDFGVFDFGVFDFGVFDFERSFQLPPD
jgi:hypothetical protein